MVINQISSSLTPQVVLKHFGVKYRYKGTYLQAKCPCHTGDNQNSFSILINEKPGVWQCYTKECHTKYGNGIIGLVKGILTNRGEVCNYYDAMNYCKQVLGGKLEDAAPELSIKAKPEPQKKIAKAEIVSELDIPSPYFIKKGFSPEILKEFSIGDCWNPQKPMFGRAVCPIFDKSGKYLVGCAGRIIEEKTFLQKWKYSYKFRAGSYFYGYWRNWEDAQKKSEIILVEGQTDVVRGAEFGYNFFGLFGARLTNNQLDLLNKLGISRLKILMDGDTAGKEAALRIYDKTKEYFNVDICDCPTGKDPDELSKEELKAILYG